MVDHIREAGHLHSSGIERALRTVPRHLFVPDATVHDAYANKSVTTKPGPDGGRPASCASQPTVVAMMLSQLDARPGDRVLEIGAGTGYNAALLAERVCEQIRAWNRNRADQPLITAYPAGAPFGQPASGQIMDKQFTRLVVAF